MYITGSYRLTPQRTECKHFVKDSAFNFLQDRTCLQNSLGGGGGANPFSAIRLIGDIFAATMPHLKKILMPHKSQLRLIQQTSPMIIVPNPAYEFMMLVHVLFCIVVLNMHTTVVWESVFCVSSSRIDA